MSAHPHSPPSFGRAALHLAALWALGAVGPLLDLLGRNPEFFIAHGNTGFDIAIFAVALAILPPAGGVAAEAVGGMLDSRVGLHGWRSVRGAIHLVLIAAFAALFTLQIVDDILGTPAGLKIALALAGGVTLAFFCTRTSFVPNALDVMSIAPVLFIGLFLASSDAGELVFSQADAKAAKVEISRPAPVVMIILDEIPAAALIDSEGGIDRSLFPNFAKLEASSTWYRNAMAAGAFTEKAVPAILTGDSQEGEELATYQDQPGNLFTLLGGSYEMRAIEPVTNICPPALCEDREDRLDRLRSLVSDSWVVGGHLLLPESLRVDLPQVDAAFEDFTTTNRPRDAVREGIDTRLDDIERFLDGLGTGEGPSLDLIHVELPHRPWEYLPDGRRYPRLDSDDIRVGGVKGGFARWGDDSSAVRINQQRMLLQTGFVDRIIGRTIERLKQAGLWRRAAFVIAADHGVSFIPNHSGRKPDRVNAGGIANVPLFIKAPGQTAGRRSDAAVRTIDILPTLAAELGVELPFAVDGVPTSAVPESRPLRIEPGDGPTFKLPFNRLLQLRDEVAARKVATFGSEQGWDRVLAAGPGAMLVGRGLGSLRLDAGHLGHAKLDHSEFYRDPAGSDSPPALVSGSIEGKIPAETRLAVAIDGRIAGVGASYELNGNAGFQILVNPGYLRRDPRRIELFEQLGGERVRSLGRLL